MGTVSDEDLLEESYFGHLRSFNPTARTMTKKHQNHSFYGDFLDSQGDFADKGSNPWMLAAHREERATKSSREAYKLGDFLYITELGDLPLTLSSLGLLGVK